MNKFIIGLLVIVAGVVAGWYVWRGGWPLAPIGLPKTPTPTVFEEVAVTPTIYPEESVTEVSGQTIVRYTDSGFSPKSVTVKKGTTVSFINEASDGMWVASDVHPTHQLLPGFDQLKSVAKGGTYEYTFIKVGTWKYHNHVNPTDTGTVIVTE